MGVLRGEDLAVAVGGRPLLQGLTFSLDRGETLQVTGPSGTGKTSLLRVLAYLDDPSGGTVSLDGRAPEAMGVPVYRRQVVYVPQRPVMWDADVRGNLSRALSFTGAVTTFDEAQAVDWLTQLGLGSLDLDADATRLSEGERQRVALVRALMLRPRVLLLDEPTSALDSAHRSAVEALLQDLQVDGLALVLVTHDAEQGRRMGGRRLDLAGFRVEAA